VEKHLTRRAVLVRALQLPLGAGVVMGLSACDGEESGALVCADPSTLTSAEQSVRRTLNYVEVSPDPARVCAGCEFFTAPAGGTGCGTCEMYGGGSVNPGGHCDSWS
jgi:hypothetical protein